MGGDEVGREAAGADHQQDPRIGSRQQVGAERRVGGGLAVCHGGGVDDGRRAAVSAVEQHIDGLDRRSLREEPRIGGHDADKLGTHGNARQEGGKGEPGLALAARAHGMQLASIDQRLVAAMGRQKCCGQLPVVADGMDLGGGHDVHGRAHDIPGPVISRSNLRAMALP